MFVRCDSGSPRREGLCSHSLGPPYGGFGSIPCLLMCREGRGSGYDAKGTGAIVMEVASRRPIRAVKRFCRDPGVGKFCVTAS
jgi:hypothetical protein